MLTLEGLASAEGRFTASTVCIGAFDGVHLGHQALINATVRDARAAGRSAVVLTFDRRPAEVVGVAEVPGYLTTPEQRARAFAACGADAMVVARFDEELRATSPERFAEAVLAGTLRAGAVVVGQGFRYGRRQAGDINSLRTAGRRLGYDVVAVRPVLYEGVKVSSTRIRDLILGGAVSEAARLLGRPFALAGQVVAGQRIGRRLGYPTANLQPSYRQVTPADGVYACWAVWGGTRLPAACGVGVRPTVGSGPRSIEAHVIGFDGDLYGCAMELEFVARLRGEQRFDSPDALARQIGHDVQAAIEALGAGMPAVPTTESS
ncbi:MAG TPA: bifunctional riboflavin kinase/FAD synthetase [Chthonomonadales bacterium]|nr:bifunctional riboflavin kinase/FAD synthetase [Chthonomonadales bacterium]